MNRSILPLLVLLLLIAGCKEEVKKSEPIRPVRVLKIQGQDAPELRTFPGKVKATQEASLAFRLSGEIVKFTVKEGDYVTKGQLIAKLDQRDYLAAAADLKAKLAGARSVLQEAKLNIERNRELLAKRIIAQSAFDTAHSTYETSRAEVLSLEQSLRRAQLNLQYTRLEAPFSGTVAIKHVENHEFVQAKEPIVQLEDTSALDIVLDIPETVWVKGFDGGNATIDKAYATFESFPDRTFPLVLKEFQTKASPGTQTYEVTFSMNNPNGVGVHPGMTAEVKGDMSGTPKGESVTVPFSSVGGTPQGEKYVWVLGKDGTVNKRHVVVDRIVNGKLCISKGIRKDETIVVAGVNYLQEGQKVKVLKGRIGGRE